jgi:hypothetical protein
MADVHSPEYFLPAAESQQLLHAAVLALPATLRHIMEQIDLGDGSIAVPGRRARDNTRDRCPKAIRSHPPAPRRNSRRTRGHRSAAHRVTGVTLPPAAGRATRTYRRPGAGSGCRLPAAQENGDCDRALPQPQAACLSPSPHKRWFSPGLPGACNHPRHGQGFECVAGRLIDGLAEIALPVPSGVPGPADAYRRERIQGRRHHQWTVPVPAPAATPPASSAGGSPVTIQGGRPLSILWGPNMTTREGEPLRGLLLRLVDRCRAEFSAE